MTQFHSHKLAFYNIDTFFSKCDEVEGAAAGKDVEATDESSKDEEELAKFWSESDDLVLSAPTGHKLKDIAKYEVTVSNTLPVDQSLDQIEAESKVINMFCFLTQGELIVS